MSTPYNLKAALKLAKNKPMKFAYCIGADGQHQIIVSKKNIRKAQLKEYEEQYGRLKLLGTGMVSYANQVLTFASKAPPQPKWEASFKKVLREGGCASMSSGIALRQLNDGEDPDPGDKTEPDSEGGGDEQPIASDADKAQADARLAKLTPIIRLTLEKEPALKGEIAHLVKQAREKIAAGQMQKAETDIDSLKKLLLKAQGTQPGQTPPAPTAAAASEALAKLSPSIAFAAKQNPKIYQTLKDYVADAKKHIETQDVAGAMDIIASIKKITSLNFASTPNDAFAKYICKSTEAQKHAATGEKLTKYIEEKQKRYNTFLSEKVAVEKNIERLVAADPASMYATPPLGLNNYSDQYDPFLIKIPYGKGVFQTAINHLKELNASVLAELKKKAGGGAPGKGNAGGAILSLQDKITELLPQLEGSQAKTLYGSALDAILNELNAPGRSDPPEKFQEKLRNLHTTSEAFLKSWKTYRTKYDAKRLAIAELDALAVPFRKHKVEELKAALAAVAEKAAASISQSGLDAITASLKEIEAESLKGEFKKDRDADDKRAVASYNKLFVELEKELLTTKKVEALPAVRKKLEEARQLALNNNYPDAYAKLIQAKGELDRAKESTPGDTTAQLDKILTDVEKPKRDEAQQQQMDQSVKMFDPDYKQERMDALMRPAFQRTWPTKIQDALDKLEAVDAAEANKMRETKEMPKLADIEKAIAEAEERKKAENAFSRTWPTDIQNALKKLDALDGAAAQKLRESAKMPALKDINNTIAGTEIRIAKDKALAELASMDKEAAEAANKLRESKSTTFEDINKAIAKADNRKAIRMALNRLESLDYDEAQKLRASKSCTLEEIENLIETKGRLISPKNKKNLQEEFTKERTALERQLKHLPGLKKGVLKRFDLQQAMCLELTANKSNAAYDRMIALRDDIKNLAETRQNLDTKIDQQFGKKSKWLHASATCNILKTELKNIVKATDATAALHTAFTDFERDLDARIQASNQSIRDQSAFESIAASVGETLAKLRPKGSKSKYLGALDTRLSQLKKLAGQEASATEALLALKALKEEIDGIAQNPQRIMEGDADLIKAAKTKELNKEQWESEKNSFKKNYADKARKAVSSEKGDQTLLNTLDNMIEDAKRYAKTGDYGMAIHALQPAKDYAEFVIQNPGGMRVHSRKNLPLDGKHFAAAVNNFNTAIASIIANLDSMEGKDLDGAKTKAKSRLAQLARLFDPNAFSPVIDKLMNSKKDPKQSRREREEGMQIIQKYQTLLTKHPLMHHLPTCPFNLQQTASAVAGLDDALNRLSGNIVTCC